MTADTLTALGVYLLLVSALFGASLYYLIKS